MRVIKLSVLTILVFIIAWIIFRTFQQPVFQIYAQLQIPLINNPKIAIKHLLVGSFVLGLCIGLFITVYNYLTLSLKLRKKEKDYKELSAYTDSLKNDLEGVTELSSQRLPLSAPEDGELPEPQVKGSLQEKDLSIEELDNNANENQVASAKDFLDDREETI